MLRFICMSFVLCLYLTSCYANPHSGGLVSTGHSAQYRQDDSHGNYEFGYNEDHAEGGTFRKEKGGPGGVVGSYGLRGADGRMRIVHYIADEHGFRATIETNEPGVDTNQSPAGVAFTNGHQMPSMHVPEHSESTHIAEHVPAHSIEHVPEHVPEYIPARISSHIEPVETVLHRPSTHTPLALSHSLATPVIASAPLSYRSSHYEPDYHHSPVYEAVLAPLMHSTHVHPKAQAFVDATPNYSHLEYVPEDGLHMSAYDGDFGRRFTPLKAPY